LCIRVYLELQMLVWEKSVEWFYKKWNEENKKPVNDCGLKVGRL
jgi:hypothetical protein